jgi:hypothetical protein
MQIATNNNIAKIISGILATISIVVIARIVFPAIWFWIAFEVSAALLVAVGCAGEWYLHHHPAGRKKVEKEEHHKLESRFIAAVVLGVFMEFFALGHAIPEAVRLEKDVASANDRAFTNELQVLDLKTNLAELNKATLELAHQFDLSTNALAEANARLEESKLAAIELQKLKQDRTITPEQQMQFVSFLKRFPKKPMWVAAASLAGENGRFVNKIRALLDAAGYAVTSSTPPIDGISYPNGIIEHGGGMSTDASSDIEIWVDASDGNSTSFDFSPEFMLRFAFEEIPDFSVSVVNAVGLGKDKSFIFVSPKQGF